MSQTGTILSVTPLSLPGSNDWTIQYSYFTDAGAPQQFSVVVGNVDAPLGYSPYPKSIFPRVAFWASATSTVTVSPNPPGTTNPVVLTCPPLIQFAAFGIPQKGIPFV